MNETKVSHKSRKMFVQVVLVPIFPEVKCIHDSLFPLMTDG